MADVADVNFSQMRLIRQRASDSTKDFLFYMSWVHGLILSEPQFVVAERLMYGQRRELILGPPGCGKSTVFGCWLEWTLGWDPNFRWLVLSEIMTGRAVEHVRSVGDTIQNDEKYHLCFGQLGGRPQKEEWSSQSLRLRTLDHTTPAAPFPWLPPRGRRPNVDWPNLSAVGWRSVKAGARADAIGLDDYVSERVSNSKAQTERARSVFAKVVSTRLSSHPRERIVVLGQRWMPRDFYGLIMEGTVGGGGGAATVYDNNKMRDGLHVLEPRAA